MRNRDNCIIVINRIGIDRYIRQQSIVEWKSTLDQAKERRTCTLLELDWRGKCKGSARKGEDKGVAVHCEGKRIVWYDWFDGEWFSSSSAITMK